MNNKSLIIIIVVLLLLATGIAWIWGSNTPAAPENPIVQDDVVCTLEAKICPDGSTVGRVPPSCEFEACPSPTIETTDQWQTATDTEAGVTFSYPQTLPTFYIEPVDWPPSVQIQNEPFTCSEAGEATDRTGQTESRTVNGTEFCVTTVTEGAAGSVYNQYAYAFETDEQHVAVLTFSTRSTQCDNYDADQQSACELERSTFDQDDLVEQIAQSLMPL